MPQAVVGIFQAAIAVLTSAGITGTIARIAFSALLSTLSSKLFGPKVPPAVGLSSRDVTVRSALEYRKIVYGQARVSGPVAYVNTSDTSNKLLWYVIPMCWGESEDLVSVWIDKNEIPKADIAWTAGTGGADGTGTGEVSTARWVGASSSKAVKVRYYLGEDAQPVCGALDTAHTEITSTFRLRGVTYCVFEFLYNENTEQVWQSGAPGNLAAVIKGRKIYDPRLDSTNGGSGAHRYTDATTWEWSANPALCVADYLVTYMAVDPATSINWASVSAAADDCDATVEVPPAASPANTETRFTCNGALSLGTAHRENLEALLSSMDGRLSYASGQWYVRASVWEASSVSIDEDDLAGPVEVRGSAPRSERFNTVRGYYVDPDRDFEAVEFQHVTAAEYVTRDAGKTIEYDLQLPCTNSEFMAQRIAFRVLEQGDNQIIVDLTLKLAGANVKVGDVVSVTVSELGWSSKTFRVIRWSRDAAGNFKLTCREDSSDRYTDPLVSDYTTKTNGTITVPSNATPAPSGLTATSTRAGIRLQWTNPAARAFEWIDVYESASSAWGSASLVASVRTDTLDLDYAAGTTRWFWVRARSFLNVESLRNPDSDTSSITATSGLGALAHYLTQEAHVVDAASDGTGYSLAGAAGTHIVIDGTTDVTTTAVHSIVGGTDGGANWTKAQNGLTLTVVEATGAYSLSGASWTSDEETFTIRATYGGVSLDKVYTISKAKAGADGATGATGGDGNSVFFCQQFKRSASPPSTPTGGSYNFSTQTLTPSSTWSATPPASDGNPLYVSTSIAEINGTSGTDSTLTWTSPAELVSDGADGADGADAPGVAIIPFTAISQDIGTLPRTAEITFETDGSLTVTGDSGLTWYSAAPSTGIGSSYDVRCSSVISGSWDLTAAATGTWIQISSARTWSVTRTVMEGAGSDQCSAVFQVRLTSGSAVLDEMTASAEAADA